MRVHGAPAVRVDERLRQDRAEPGDRDEVDVVALQHVDDVVRVRDAVEARAEVGALDELGRDAVLRAMSSAPHGRSAITTTIGRLAFEQGLEDGSAARCQDADPHARHPIPRRPSDLSAGNPQVRTEKGVSLPVTRGGEFMADRQSPTPGEITIMAAGAVMLIFSFLHFAGDTSAWGKQARFRSRRSCRSTAW